MIPTRSTLSLLLGLVGSLTGALHGVPALDHVTLEDGSSLTGTVQGINSEGLLTLESEISSQPIVLRGEALAAIEFATQGLETPTHPHRLHLVNGDILPGGLQALDDQSLRLDTWYAGLLEIPRAFVESVEFGIDPQKRVYFGPQGTLADWTDIDDWELDNGRLVSESSGTIARPDTLPEQFILRFRVEWQSSPNFRLYFCDDHLKRHGRADRYYFEINSGGLQLKRETAEAEQRWYTIMSGLRRPEEFDGGLEVEIRVDRNNKLIYVYVDGEQLGRYSDGGNFPTGTGILLQSQASGDSKNIVPYIEVFEWDAITQLRRTEGHDDPTTDAIVDSKGEHYSGRILRLEEPAENGERRVLLESPHSEQPIAIGTNNVSSLYFRKQDVAEGAGQIHFELRGGGRLRLNSLSLGGESLSAEHPLLKAMSLNRDALKQLTVARTAPGGGAEPESNE